MELSSVSPSCTICIVGRIAMVEKWWYICWGISSLVLLYYMYVHNG